jgi:hypothetical protein
MGCVCYENRAKQRNTERAETARRDCTENTEKNLSVLCGSSVCSVFLLYAIIFIVRGVPRS